MLFNSIEFLVFFIFSVILYHLLPQKLKAGFLMLASWYFYSFWDLKFLFLIIFTTTINYAFGLCIDNFSRAKAKLGFLLASIVVNLFVLGVFKYYHFFIENFVWVLKAVGVKYNLSVLNIVLPVGISFYTFQTMSYVIDVYRGRIQACKNLFDFGAYASFFPLLLAGPIERASNIIPQLKNYKSPTSDDLISGFYLCVWGLFKKIVIADNLTSISDYVFTDNCASPLDSGLALLAAYAYAFQIYCDFSGYTDMARGCAKFFGIDLTINFNLPYRSESIREFWRRWHISLSTWFKDYLYIPLGGNRDSAFKTYRNVLITMSLCGLWHGASWMYVAWGMYHGLLMVLERSPLYIRFVGNIQSKWVKQMLTFHLISVGWVIFRSPDINVFTHWSRMLFSMQFHPDYFDLWLYLLFFLSPLFLMGMPKYNWRIFNTSYGMYLKQAYPALMMILLYFGLTIYGADQARAFIYFQF